jgi:TRAP-type mannitol/chloroaromatic compound transport system permease large subunit
MPIQEILDVLMFVVVCGFLLAGFPVAFTLAGTALIFALLGWALGVFETSFFGALPSRIYGNAMTNVVLIAVPVFIFMGVMLERSRVAEELLDTMGKLFGTLRGGLGISVAVVGALMAASTGIVGATVVTMGLLSLPTMLRRGYAPSLACGSICASGTLGQIIPPSIVLVLLGDQISNAYTKAQRAMGNWSPEPVSVGDLFAGALLPGLMLVGLYIAYQILMAWLRPETSPPIPAEETEQGWAMTRKVLRALIPPVILIVAVLGSILAGVATPTEAASVGAMGATLLAGLRITELENTGEATPPHGPRGPVSRLLDNGSSWPMILAFASLVVVLLLQSYVDLRVKRDSIPTGDWVGIIAAAIACLVLLWGLLSSLVRVFNRGILTDVVRSTMAVTSMVFVILVGAAVFSLVFRGLGGEEMVHELLTNMPGGLNGAIIIVMVVMFILGFFLDFIEITLVVVPMVAPALLQSDLSPVWLGVMMAMNLQTSFLTPPFGFALFYLRGVAPTSVETMAIYRGAIPFVIIQLFGLVLLSVFPSLATWLPNLIFG